MDLATVFGGDSLTVQDLGNKEPTVIIESVGIKEFENGNKLIIRFRGAKKYLVCNATNAKKIGRLYGTETDEWVGKPITLWADPDVEYAGKVVGGIRVKAPSKTEVAPRHVVTDRGGYSTHEQVRPDSTQDALGDEQWGDFR